MIGHRKEQATRSSSVAGILFDAIMTALSVAFAVWALSLLFPHWTATIIGIGVAFGAATTFGYAAQLRRLRRSTSG